MSDSSDGRGLAAAFDELRFGRRNILNLREQQPSADEAVAICESWLRQKQVEGAGELLVITGRGKGSPDGVSIVRTRVASLLVSLRRRNVVKDFREHNPGSFVVKPAPINALFERMPRRREKTPLTPLAAPVELLALELETLDSLRELAQLQLSSLGIQAPERSMIEHEMLHQYSVLSAALIPGTDSEAVLQQGIYRAIEEFID